MAPEDVLSQACRIRLNYRPPRRHDLMEEDNDNDDDDDDDNANNGVPINNGSDGEDSAWTRISAALVPLHLKLKP